jgi:hypothetical protein
MKYQSVGEYFYKMYSVLFLYLLIPMLALGGVYWANRYFLSIDPASRDLILGALITVVVLDWLMAWVWFNQAVKGLLTLVSLGERLQRYFKLMLIRFSIFAVGLFMLVAAYAISGNRLAALAFGLHLVLALLIWPFPSRVVQHLKLKGNERELVLGTIQ